MENQKCKHGIPAGISLNGKSDGIGINREKLGDQTGREKDWMKGSKSDKKKRLENEKGKFNQKTEVRKKRNFAESISRSRILLEGLAESEF